LVILLAFVQTLVGRYAPNLVLG